MKKKTLYVCFNCGAMYNTPKNTCLNPGCAVQFDSLNEMRGLRQIEVSAEAYNEMIAEMKSDLNFVHCSCSGDHCPNCVIAV